MYDWVEKEEVLEKMSLLPSSTVADIVPIDKTPEGHSWMVVGVSGSMIHFTFSTRSKVQ